jgi:hypothetical protein
LAFGKRKQVLESRRDFLPYTWRKEVLSLNLKEKNILISEDTSTQRIRTMRVSYVSFTLLLSEHSF